MVWVFLCLLLWVKESEDLNLISDIWTCLQDVPSQEGLRLLLEKKFSSGQWQYNRNICGLEIVQSASDNNLKIWVLDQVTWNFSEAAQAHL